jgi:hypothetical protein
MKYLVPSILLSFASGSVSGAPVEWNGHYYEFVRAPGIDWTSAHIGAQASVYNGLPGHLATLTAEPENVFVASLVDGVVSYPGDPSSDSVLEAWVGGFQFPSDELDSSKGWRWVHGEGTIATLNGSSPYANWFTGEPNDWLGLASENHMGIWGNDGYGNTIGSWNDEGGLWNISGYLVEYEASRVPEGGASVTFMCVALFGLFGAARLTGILHTSQRRVRARGLQIGHRCW